MDKNILIDNLRRGYAKAGYSVERGFYRDLAKRFGVSRQAVGDWFDPDSSYPRLAVLVQMAKDIGMSLDELLTGKRPEIIIELEPPKIPVFSLSDLKKINFEVEQPEMNIVPKTTINTPIGVNANDLLAVLQEGESMTSANGFSFPDGSIVAFDTTKKKPTSGELILAYLPNGKVIFRKYTKEEQEYLVPLNLSAYKSYSSDFHVIGVFLFSIVLSRHI